MKNDLLKELLEKNYSWEKELKTTIKNIELCCEENGATSWINVNQSDPGFERAFNTLMSKALSDISSDSSKESFYFWLEDDWALKVGAKDYLIKRVRKFLDNTETNVALFFRKSPSGPPWMCTGEWFKKFAESVDLKSGLDPEIKIKNYHEHEIKKAEMKRDIISWSVGGFFVPVVFEDAGRKWRDDLGIEKWTRSDKINPDIPKIWTLSR